MNDVTRLVSTVFSGLCTLVIEDAGDDGVAVCVRARTGTERWPARAAARRPPACTASASGRWRTCPARPHRRHRRCMAARSFRRLGRVPQFGRLRRGGPTRAAWTWRLTRSSGTLAPGSPNGSSAPHSTGRARRPYRDHLRKRRTEDPAVPVRQLGYQGSSNLLVRYVTQGRAEADRPHLSPCRAAQSPLTRPAALTIGQHEMSAGLAAAFPGITRPGLPHRFLRGPADPGPGQRQPAQPVNHRRAPLAFRTCTPSPAGSTWTSRPPLRRSRSRTQWPHRRSQHQSKMIKARCRDAPGSPSSVTHSSAEARSVTTEGATEPLK